MSELLRRIQEAESAVRRIVQTEPEVGIILGTGLGDLSDVIKEPKSIPYAEIPHFPRSTVEFHAGELVFGTLSGRQVVVMKGRVHYYEGYTMQQVTFPVRVMRALGVRTLVVNSAVGAMNPLFELGRIVIVDDHINLMGDNPLIGPNDEELGPRFPDMSDAYSAELVALSEQVALEERIPIHRGVLVAVAGPNLETAAEYRFLRLIGADVVGMSLVPECIVANHAGIRVLGLAVITDRCLPDALEPVEIARILEVASEAAPKLTRLVAAVVARL